LFTFTKEEEILQDPDSQDPNLHDPAPQDPPSHITPELIEKVKAFDCEKGNYQEAKGLLGALRLEPESNSRENVMKALASYKATL
jgi:hypothetical protein